MDWGLLVWVLTIAVPVMLGTWLGYAHSARRNAAWADVGFCVGFGLVAVSVGLTSGGEVSHRVVLAAMGAIYAFRLAAYIVWNRILHVSEDQRYRFLREKWGDRAETCFFLYFVGQALAILVFSIPLLVVAGNHGSTWTGWELLGIVVWAVGVGGESLADDQLRRFRRNPDNNGKVCREGLWRYSRHPNYFFDVVYWCAYVVMSIGGPDWWLTLIGPVVMLGALLKVTGVPLAEAQAVASRGEAYREYQRTTSAFIPWFPKG